MVNDRLLFETRYTLSNPYNLRLQGFYFLFLCLDHRHKQKHLASSTAPYVLHDNKLMKKSNAQAEPPSSPGELLRASRPRTDIFEQNDTATGLACYVVHVLFLFFNRLQAQAYSRGLRALRGSSPPPPLTFLIDYKHKHTATGVASHVSHVRFFLFF